MNINPINAIFSQASPLVYGCMGLGGGWNNNGVAQQDITQAQQVIETALAQGINYFDHADIYTFGKAEQVFGEVLKQQPNLREQMIIQTKCGIRFEDDKGPKRYDLSSQWITQSVENSLCRLHCDYLDVLVLHRPDPLMQVDEIAEIFSKLNQTGKVKHLGVSNMQQHQIHQLQQALSQPIVVNQVEMSLQKHDWLDETVYAGNTQGQHVNFTAGMLEYCKNNRIQVQAWGSLCQGLYTKTPSGDAPTSVVQTQKLVAQLAQQYSATPEAILLAWLMRHPMQIQPVIGTTSLDRIKACAQVANVNLSREDWYRLYVSAKGQELP